MRFMMPLLIGLSLCNITAIAAAVREGSSPEPVGETSGSRCFNAITKNVCSS